jgi:hypothetical protein
MACLGVHFALSHDDVAALVAASTDEDRLDLLHEMEEQYFEDRATHVAESDKAWDGMHRTLADGLLSYDGGQYPLNHAVLGGTVLYYEDDYIMSLKSPQQVKDVAAAIAAMTEEDFKHRYLAIDAHQYDGELNDEDFAYTWDWFQHVRNLFQLAAAEGLHVLFTADQ